MSVVLITGSAGLIGSEAVRFFAGLGHQVIGLDNNMRQYFFLVLLPRNSYTPQAVKGLPA